MTENRFAGISSIPIFTEESLSSIVISEIDLPTEATALDDKESFAETEKPESFVELYEKYDEQFIKNTTTGIIIDNENPLQKRSSDNDTPDDVSTKSLIEKIQKIDDPEVRKEFENEILNNGQSAGGEKASVDGTSEYDPIYSKKLIAVSDNGIEYDMPSKSDKDNSVQDYKVDDTKKMTVHEKEILQGHMVEQLVQMNDSNVESTTVIPEESFQHHEMIKNPEVVEVLEHIVYQSTNEEPTEETTVNPLNVQVDFDPIQIIPNDRHRLRNVDTEETTENNDKFVGFKPSEDLVEPGEETTEPDQFFKKEEIEDETVLKTAEAIVDTLEFVGIFGKSLQFTNASGEGAESKSLDNVADVITTEKPEEFTGESTTVVAPAVVEAITEIVEVRTEVSVTILVGDKEGEELSSSDESHKHSSSSNKSDSSEESSESKEKSKKHKSRDESKDDKSKEHKSDSSEENSAREIFDTDDLRILDLNDKHDHKNLMDDLYRDTLNHEVKKKDHPVEQQSLPYETVANKFNAEDEIARHLEEKIKPDETTTVGVFETFEDVVTTLSDGIKLSNEFRASIDSFRGFAEENKTILDTNSEAISSKNIKNSLVNIVEEMTLENHVESSRVPYVMVAFIGLASAMVLVGLYVVVKRTTLRAILY